jgi:acetyl esterase/lipase
MRPLYLGPWFFAMILPSAGWTAAQPPQLPEGTTVLRDQEYVKGGHPRQKLDLYLPKRNDSRPLPVVVWVHGGAWKAGSKGAPLIPNQSLLSYWGALRPGSEKRRPWPAPWPTSTRSVRRF